MQRAIFRIQHLILTSLKGHFTSLYFRENAIAKLSVKVGSVFKYWSKQTFVTLLYLKVKKNAVTLVVFVLTSFELCNQRSIF